MSQSLPSKTARNVSNYLTTDNHAQKKKAHAAGRRRSDVNAAREAWFDGQLDLDPERLVFIDETGANTKMARLYGRSLRGQRLSMSVDFKATLDGKL